MIAGGLQEEGRSANPPPHEGLAARVTAFGDFLRARGFRVFPTGVQDALACLRQINIQNRSDFLTVLRANLVSNDMEWGRFPALFQEYWDRLGPEEAQEPHSPPEPAEKHGEQGSDQPDQEEDVQQTVQGEAADQEKKWWEGGVYSPLSLVEKKDLGKLDQKDVKAAELVLKRMAELFRPDRSRRRKKTRSPADLDFARTLRESLKTEGWAFKLFYKEKKRRLKRLVILADVSGSMDRYARFVIPFLLGLRGVGSRAEVFVFSTTLASITWMIRHLPVEKALDRLAEEFPEWSGGTRIGYSLHKFNQAESGRMLNRRSVVLILSDGWDLGAKEMLRREMAALSRKAHRVIWLNPLAGDPDYQPLCKGMRTALPYIDHLLAADSLESLRRVGGLLSKMISR
ncbi:MAG: vWA domain-containing protein [Desulfobacteraceae bacterium]